MCPPLTSLPGFTIGSTLRALALPLREVTSIFTDSVILQLGDMATYSTEWVESFLWTPLPAEPGKPAAGQRLVTVIFGVFALRTLRLWG